MQIRLTQMSALALGIAGVLALGSAHATGFQLRENSVKNLGRANSGTTVASDDASVVANNPAAMVNLTKSTFQLDATDIDLDADFTGGGYADAGTPLQNPLSGGNGGDPGSPKVVPAVAFVMPVADTFRLGASVDAPYGLKTEYDADWVGRYNAINSDVKTVDLNLSAAWSVTPEFSVGVGAIYQRTEVTLSNAIDFGSALCAGSGNPLNCLNPAFPFHPQGADGVVSVKGSANDWGWLAGAQWKVADNFVLGYAHHSKIGQTLKGTADFTLPASVAATFAALGNTAYNDGAIYAPLTTPSTDTLSAQWNVVEGVRLYGDIQHTGWHSLQQVAIFRANGAPLGPAEQFNWDDTMYYAVGIEWDVSPEFTLRGGYGHDETPTSDATRDARLPDNNRQLFSIGATWHASEALSIDAAYQHITISDPSINVLTSSGSSLTGTYSANADLFGLSLQYRF